MQKSDPHNIKKHAGLTLVELIVTIVILSVIATVAIPGLQAYTVKARVKTVIDAGMAAQLQINDEILDGQDKDTINYSSASTSFTSSKNPYVTSIDVVKGKIEIVANDAQLGLTGFTTDLRPNVKSTDNVEWECVTPKQHHSYVPPECRCEWVDAVEWTTWSAQDFTEVVHWEVFEEEMFDCDRLPLFCAATGASPPGPPANTVIPVGSQEWVWEWSKYGKALGEIWQEFYSFTSKMRDSSTVKAAQCN